MIYAEAAFFDGNHCKHVAEWEDHKRHIRLREAARRNAADRRMFFEKANPPAPAEPAGLIVGRVARFV